MKEEIHYTARAAMRRKTRIKQILGISILTAVSCAGIALGIFSIVRGSVWFAVAYLIAAAGCVMITIIKFNTVFPPMIAVNQKRIFMRTWDNHIVPYHVGIQIPVIYEFIPAKIQQTEIAVGDIRKIVIGTKNYLKRQCADDTVFIEIIEQWEKAKAFHHKSFFAAIDFLYLREKNGKSYFMSIQHFDEDEIVKVLNEIEKNNPAVEFLCSNKEIKRARLKMPIN